MKQILVGFITVVATWAQLRFIGLNGLTLISMPITLFLGLEIIDRITIKEQKKEQEETNKEQE